MDHFRNHIAHSLSLAKFLLIFLIISGMNPFDWFRMQTPGAYNWLLNNKVRFHSVRLDEESLRFQKSSCFPFIFRLNPRMKFINDLGGQFQTSGCLMLFFISGMIETQLISTGAFEIYLNEDQLWSKIKTGKVPEFTDLFNMIDERRNTLFSGTENLDVKQML